MNTKLYISFFQFRSYFKRFNVFGRKTFSILSTIFIISINPVQAEDAVPDKFRISLGGYTVVRYESVMSLTDANLGAGISISPEDTLGLQTEQTVIRLDGYYRFTKTHALTYSWYRISSDGNKSLEEEIDWVDGNGDPITIPIGADVNTSFDYDIYKLGYLYSFYHTDKIDVSVGAGLHVTRIAVGLQASATNTGVDTKDVNTTLPLPVVSFGLVYHVTPKFAWHVKSELFALQFENWDGSYIDSALGMEYRIFKNVGLGIALSTNSLKLIEDTSDYKFDFDNRIAGVLVNVAAYF